MGAGAGWYWGLGLARGWLSALHKKGQLLVEGNGVFDLFD